MDKINAPDKRKLRYLISYFVEYFQRLLARHNVPITFENRQSCSHV